MIVLGKIQVHADSSNHNEITNLELVGVLLEGEHDSTAWYWLWLKLQMYVHVFCSNVNIIGCFTTRLVTGR